MAVVRKSEFAAMCNVSQGRVSQWLTEGKIDGAAIIGTGRSAKIDVDLAMAQVKSRRAFDESCGLNGLGTELDGTPPVNRPVRQVRDGEALVTVASQLQAEKLKQQKFLTSRLDIEDRARHGVYIDTNGSVGALNRLGSEMLSMFEGVLHDFASDHAAKFKISYRESLVLHRERFRKLREQMAAVQRAAAAQKPKTIEPEE